ncbi:MAG: S8 family serine peptidase, partial [Pirellulaceae bacterium]|nr:S8 family serine peptidase [Pirellulaceae bacterium]
VIRADHDGDTNLDSVYLINAFCEWLDQVAGNRPLVVSCSWGGQRGGRDGQTIAERHLSSLFPLDKVGRAICFAAGNQGDFLIHAPVAVGTQARPGEFSWVADGRALVTIYVESDDLDDLFIGGVDDTVIDPNNVHSYVNPLTKHAVLQVGVTGNGKMYVYSGKGSRIGADAYIDGRAVAFSEESYDLSKQPAFPSTADNVLSVGSYDWNDQFSYRGSIRLLTDVVHDQPLVIGVLSAYSNPGPRRFGDVFKPELVAPGQWYTAPAPQNVSTMRDSTGQYHTFNGTSSATPYTAGVIALALQANPRLTWGRLRGLLTANLTEDARTGKTPNGKWGYGKLDFAAAERFVTAAGKSK